MVRMIMELVRNLSFILTTGDSQHNWLCLPSNGVFHGSVLASFYFSIYTYDRPSMISRKFIKEDNLALLHFSGKWKTLKGLLTQDMTTLLMYLEACKLKLSHTKEVTAVFRLHNQLAQQKLNVCKSIKLLPFCSTPIYFVAKLDRSLTFRHHLVGNGKKLSLRVILLRNLQAENGY